MVEEIIKNKNSYFEDDEGNRKGSGSDDGSGKGKDKNKFDNWKDDEHRNAHRDIHTRKSFQVDRYHQLCFTGILGYPNPFPKDFRLALVRFSGNNALSGEDHLKEFSYVMDDFEVEAEDVMMMFFYVVSHWRCLRVV